ncbi:MAG TPA: hypothetical protein VM597_17805 [Gemmataceae bacterium]|jgi:xylan 1,4-beta-xylosidase|nr:hypothetical protein [Gemmataceae bacterium]
MPRSLLLLLLAAPAGAADLVIDAGRPGPPLRRLHGVNGGPLVQGGTLDLSAHWKALAPPLARLHDCHWPNPDVVDLHVVFPDPAADPDRPENYDFARTDEFVKAVHDTGAGIVFRLGESIEHFKIRKYVHPPKDPARWAAACVGVIRHYTEGWANGFKYHIRYWEIWNEPDNCPAMWSGSDGDYFKLYSLTAKAIKARFPKLLVGGPGLGNTGDLTGETLAPSPFFGKFLAHCREDRAPLDFFSWHCYTNDPGEYPRRARAVRKLLDAGGFPKAESHLNEWNYLPDNDWHGLLSKDSKKRRAWSERVGSAEGAAFAAAGLLRMQDGPIDVANYFSAEPSGMGLFDEYGLPKKTFHALAAVGRLSGQQLPVRHVTDGTACVAALTKDEVVVVLSRTTGRGPSGVAVENLPWPRTRFTVEEVSAARDFEEVSGGSDVGDVRVELEGAGPSVWAIRLRAVK